MSVLVCEKSEHVGGTTATSDLAGSSGLLIDTTLGPALFYGWRAARHANTAWLE